MAQIDYRSVLIHRTSPLWTDAAEHQGEMDKSAIPVWACLIARCSHSWLAASSVASVWKSSQHNVKIYRVMSLYVCDDECIYFWINPSLSVLSIPFYFSINQTPNTAALLQGRCFQATATTAYWEYQREWMKSLPIPKRGHWNASAT